MSPHFLVRIICPMDLVGAVVNVDGTRLPKEIDTDPVMVNFVIFFFQANIHKDIFQSIPIPNLHSILLFRKWR